ncbi:MAG: hypothetical protein HC831_00430 [Chloroflexia bacterium]|nr:hypothetical protein [Chloroflexia bacterium]
MLNSKNNGFLSKPYGAKIARERLNLFADKLNKKAIVEYSNLETNIGVIGTKVRIVIPYITRESDILKFEKVN